MVRLSAYWGFIVLGMSGTLLGPALLQVLGTYHISPSGAGVLFIAGTIGYTAAVLVGGPAGDVVSRRLVLLAGALIFTLGLAGFAEAPSWWLAVAAECIVGMGGGVLDSGINALANDIASPEGHATEQTLLHTFFGVGAIIGPLFIGWFLAAGYGWRPAFLAGAVASVLLALLLARLGTLPRSVAASAVSVGSVLSLARNPLMLTLILVIGLYVGEELVVGYWAATYLERIQHLQRDIAAIGVSIYWAGLTGGRLAAALVSKRFTSEQLLVGSAVLALAGSALLVAAPNAVVALVALLLTGLGFAAIFPLVMAVAGARFPDATGSIAGILTAAASIAGALLPFASGVLVQAFDARIALATCPVYGAIIVWFVLVLERGQAARAGDVIP